MARLEVPGGWTVQAFAFALDCTPEQAACVRRQFGGRRYARNWAVRTLKDDLARYRETGEETEKPSLASMRMRWNRAKGAECTDTETGGAWWPEISKEAFAGDSAVGPVRAAVKRRADRKTGPRPAGGNEARKGRSRTAAEQPRDGVPV